MTCGKYSGIILVISTMYSIANHQFKHPFACLIAGPSQSGKSTLLSRILENNDSLITPSPTKIVYCYARWSDAFNKLRVISPPIEFQEGLPDIDRFDSQQNNLLILDDLMTQVEKDKSMLELFTTDSHHANISVFLITQNLFSQGKYARTISLNCQYMFILNNPRDKAQIYNLARQMYPTNSQFLIECYEDATPKKYGYLFLVLTQTADNRFRVQTGITPNEQRIIYEAKKI